MQEHEQWMQARLAAVTSPGGNLALVRAQPVTAEPRAIEEFSVLVHHVGGENGVWLSVPPEVELKVDGQRVVGTAFVGQLQPGGHPMIESGRFRADVYSLDGEAFEVRIYDADAPHLSEFRGIETYPYDPALNVTARFEAFDQASAVAWDFTRSSDSGHTKKVPGRLLFELDGAAHELLAFTDGPQLVIVFADTTTGRESYAPGRFLRLPFPDSSSDVALDFNRTFIPPCGFSYAYSCPIPPPQNRLSIPVRAGEKRVVWAEGHV